MKQQDLQAFMETNMGNNFLSVDGENNGCNEMELNNFSALDASIQQQFTPDNNEETSSVLGMFGGFQSIIQRQREAQAAAAKAAADAAAKAAAAAVTAAAIAANQPSPRLIKSVEAAQASDAVIPAIQNIASDNATTVVTPVKTEPIGRPSKAPESTTSSTPESSDSKSRVAETKTPETTTSSTPSTSEKRYMGMSKNTGLILLGVAAVGIGAFVYFKYIKK